MNGRKSGIALRKIVVCFFSLRFVFRVEIRKIYLSLYLFFRFGVVCRRREKEKEVWFCSTVTTLTPLQTKEEEEEEREGSAVASM